MTTTVRSFVRSTIALTMLYSSCYSRKQLRANQIDTKETAVAAVAGSQLKLKRGANGRGNMKNTSENGVGDGRPVCLKIAPRKRGHRRRRRAGDVNRASLPPAMHRCLAAVAAAPTPRTLFRGTNERTNERDRATATHNLLFSLPSPARSPYLRSCGSQQ